MSKKFIKVQDDNSKSSALINKEQIAWVGQNGTGAVKIRMSNGDIVDVKITFEQFLSLLDKKDAAED